MLLDPAATSASTAVGSPVLGSRIDADAWLHDHREGRARAIVARVLAKAAEVTERCAQMFDGSGRWSGRRAQREHAGPTCDRRRVTNIPADLLVELHEKVQALRMALLGEIP